jgi:hypothetical protein
MPILQDHFYHRTIRTYTAVFGSVFNEITILRKDGTKILIPISYQIKQKYDVRNKQNSDPNVYRNLMNLPRMAFKLTDMQKDTTRITNRFNRILDSSIDVTTANSLNVQYNRVPYNFQYELAIKTKTVDDLLQIYEQIVVFFNPSIRVNILDNPDVNGTTSVTIKLLNQSIEDMFDGSFEGDQAIEATLNFELEGWLYMPASTTGIIKTININYYDLDTKIKIDSDVIT